MYNYGHTPNFQVTCPLPFLEISWGHVLRATRSAVIFFDVIFQNVNSFWAYKRNVYLEKQQTTSLRDTTTLIPLLSPKVWKWHLDQASGLVAGTGREIQLQAEHDSFLHSETNSQCHCARSAYMWWAFLASLGVFWIIIQGHSRIRTASHSSKLCATYAQRDHVLLDFLMIQGVWEHNGH